MRAGVALVVAIAGCGRLGFDAREQPMDDAAIDVVDVDGMLACTAAFCDGFEDPGLQVWTVITNGNATAMRDAAFGFRGASLHAVAPAGSSIAGMYADVFPSNASDHWVRVYVYAPSAALLDLEPVEITNAAMTSHLVFALYDDAIDIHSHSFAGDFNQTVMTPPPRDQWTCYELHVAIAASGTVELFRDGNLVVTTGGFDTRATDRTRLLVGIASKPTSQSTNLFIDEVAAGGSRVGCL